VEDCADFGIAVLSPQVSAASGSTIAVNECLTFGCGKTGFYYENKSKLTGFFDTIPIFNSHFVLNGYGGIAIIGGANPVVMENVFCWANRAVNVFLEAPSDVEIRNCRIIEARRIECGKDGPVDCWGDGVSIWLRYCNGGDGPAPRPPCPDPAPRPSGQPAWHSQITNLIGNSFQDDDADVFVHDSIISYNERAGLAAFGGRVVTKNVDFLCNGFAREGEVHKGVTYRVLHAGGDCCGCECVSPSNPLLFRGCEGTTWDGSAANGGHVTGVDPASCVEDEYGCRFITASFVPPELIDAIHP
jgi:hypothetical protein